MVWHGTDIPATGLALLDEDKRLMLDNLANSDTKDYGQREYWKTANFFIKQIWGRWLPSLSEKQRDWYYDIDARLNVVVWRHEARIASGLEKEEV